MSVTLPRYQIMFSIFFKTMCFEQMESLNSQLTDAYELQLRNSRSGTQRRAVSQPDHDVFEGLPIRHWRKRPIHVTPIPEKLPPDTTPELPTGYPELPMPKDANLLSETCYNILRLARMGVPRKDLADGNEDGENDDDGQAGALNDKGGLLTQKWSLIARESEGSEPEYLAKRRKGLPSLYGVLPPSQAASNHMRKTKIRKLDSDGKNLVWEVLVPEGQALDGEILEDETSPTEAPPPGTIVEGLGVANANGVVIAGNQITPPRRKPPPPKRKSKGRSLKDRKRVAFAGGVGGISEVGGAHEGNSSAGFDGAQAASARDGEGDSLMQDIDQEGGEDSEEGSEDEDELRPNQAADHAVSNSQASADIASPAEYVESIETQHVVHDEALPAMPSTNAISAQELPAINVTEDGSDTRTSNLDHAVSRPTHADLPEKMEMSTDPSSNDTADPIAQEETSTTNPPNVETTQSPHETNVEKATDQTRQDMAADFSPGRNSSPALPGLEAAAANLSGNVAAQDEDMPDTTGQGALSLSADAHDSGPSLPTHQDHVQGTEHDRPPISSHQVAQDLNAAEPSQDDDTRAEISHDKDDGSRRPLPESVMLSDSKDQSTSNFSVPPSPTIASPPPKPESSAILVIEPEQSSSQSPSQLQQQYQTPLAPTPSPPTPAAAGPALEPRHRLTMDSPKAPTMSPPTPARVMSLSPELSAHGQNADRSTVSDPPPFSLNLAAPPMLPSLPGLDLPPTSSSGPDQRSILPERDSTAAEEAGKIDVEAAPLVPEPHFAAEIPHEHNPLEGLAAPSGPAEGSNTAVLGETTEENEHTSSKAVESPSVIGGTTDGLETSEIKQTDDGDDDLLGNFERSLAGGSSGGNS